MNIDKRWVELLAEVAPAKVNKWFNRLGYLGMFGFLLGFIMIINGLFKPISNAVEEGQAVKMLWEGVGIGGFSLVLIGVVGIFKGKEKKKNREAFIKYYEEYKTFPPWPEYNKKPDQQYPPRTV